MRPRCTPDVDFFTYTPSSEIDSAVQILQEVV